MRKQTDEKNIPVSGVQSLLFVGMIAMFLGIAGPYGTGFQQTLENGLLPVQFLRQWLPITLFYVLKSLEMMAVFGALYLIAVLLIKSVLKVRHKNAEPSRLDPAEEYRKYKHRFFNLFIPLFILFLYFLSYRQGLFFLTPLQDWMQWGIWIGFATLLTILFMKFRVSIHFRTYRFFVCLLVLAALLPGLILSVQTVSDPVLRLILWTIVVFLSLGTGLLLVNRFASHPIRWLSLTLLALFLSAIVGLSLKTAAKNRYNVIHITLDTLRMASFNKEIMPFLFDLKDKGAYFPNSYSATDNTLPTHNAILYGKYASIVGFEKGPYPDTNLPELLRMDNYHTAMIAANGRLCIENGFNKGFDDYYEAWKTDNHIRNLFIGSDSLLRKRLRPIQRYLDIYRSKILNKARPIDKKTLGHREYRFFNYEPAEIVNEFVKTAIERSPASQPFYLLINYLDPHEPYLSPDTAKITGVVFQLKKLFPEIYQDLNFDQFAAGDTAIFAQFALMWPRVEGSDNKEAKDRFVKYCYEENVKYLDGELKLLFDYLETSGLLANTLIIVTSDHGESLGEHNLYKHRNYRLYNEEVRVPLLMVFPEIFSALTKNRVLTVNTQSVDLFPTTLDFLGILTDMPLNGISLLPFVFGIRDANTSRYAMSESLAISAIADEQYKLIIQDRMVQLYDWINDPGEKRNLAGKNQQRILALYRQLERQRGQTYTVSEHKDSDEFDPSRFDAETLQQLRSLGYIK